MEERIDNQTKERKNEKCTKCGGRGIIYPYYNNGLFTPYYPKRPPRICAKCRGTGRERGLE